MVLCGSSRSNIRGCSYFVLLEAMCGSCVCILNSRGLDCQCGSERVPGYGSHVRATMIVLSCLFAPTRTTVASVSVHTASSSHYCTPSLALTSQLANDLVATVIEQATVGQGAMHSSVSWSVPIYMAVLCRNYKNSRPKVATHPCSGLRLWSGLYARAAPRGASQNCFFLHELTSYPQLPSLPPRSPSLPVVCGTWVSCVRAVLRHCRITTTCVQIKT